jgi:hypothetical protein
VPVPADSEFSAWIAEMFDHPVTKDGRWWADDLPEAEPLPPEIAIERLRRLCEESDSWPAAFSDAQLGQGLWHVFDYCAGEPSPLTDPSVDITLRVRCIAAIERLYSKLFAKQCTEELGHLQRPGGPDWSLDGTCYMLWDIAALHDPWTTEPEPEIAEVCLRVLRAILTLPNAACQESALHGLGHWHRRQPEHVAKIIDEFVAAHSSLSPALLKYANHARAGAIQ